MRRLPKFLRIAGVKHEVLVVENLTHDDGAHEDEDGNLWAHRAYGVYDPNLLTLRFDAENGRERTKVTVLHETFHALFNLGNIQMHPEQEEEFCTRMAPLMLDFLRSNKGAVAYLQEN